MHERRKICPRCGLNKPHTEFYAVKARAHLDGLSGWCKPCKLAADRGYGRYVGGRVPAPAKKQCAKCGAVKPISQFHKKSNAKDGYRNECKPCRVEAVKEWARQNPEKVKAKEARRRQSEKYKKYHRKWREQNRDRVAGYSAADYAKHREARRATRAVYRDAHRIVRAKPTVEERFFAKVEKGTDCWLWTGAHDKHGYGCFAPDGRRAGPRKLTRAHRFAYELLVGPIPEGLTLDHLCRVPACVNPAHLEPVTLRENILRGEAPSAKQARRTHCIHGHPLDGRRADGHRYCLTCNRERSRVAQRERYWRLKRELESQRA